MTDTELMREKRETGEDKADEERSKLTFLQKYHHKGAFYQV